MFQRGFCRKSCPAMEMLYLDIQKKNQSSTGRYPYARSWVTSRLHFLDTAALKKEILRAHLEQVNL